MRLVEDILIIFVLLIIPMWLLELLYIDESIFNIQKRRSDNEGS